MENKITSEAKKSRERDGTMGCQGKTGAYKSGIYPTVCVHRDYGI